MLLMVLGWLAILMVVAIGGVEVVVGCLLLLA